MTVRWAALVIAGLDTLAWLAITIAMIFSGSDQATRGLDQLAGLAVTLVFLLTGAPALILAWRNRAPRLALVLSLSFPAAFAVLLAVAIVTIA
jgi:hypothetical protein